MPDTPETKETLLQFGTLAVQLGYTTIERVRECSQIQRKIKELGIEPKKLGEIMLDKGYLSEAQVKQIFRIQGLKGGHTQIAGYKIVSLIGNGSMGRVYKALQISMDRLVAVKVLAPQLAQNEKFVERFFHEARSVAKLNHPNIVQGIDVGESYGVHYFAMEYIDGPTLEELVKQNVLEEKLVLDIIIQVARALDHAHKNNLVHRDIKPTNIMITKENIVKLCDLGLARLLTGGVNTGGTRIIMGTPSYISPEQAMGQPDVDIRSDIYSLGVTFYYMLVGEIPFPASSAAEAINKHLTQNPIPPREKRPHDISLVTNNIVLKMMAKKREERYQTPQELLAQLEQARQSFSAPHQEVKPSHHLHSKRISVLSKLNRFRHQSKLSGLRFRYKRKPT